MEESAIVEYYSKNRSKTKKQISDELSLNLSYVSTLIDRYFPNIEILDKELENRLLEIIKLYPYTGTKNKICRVLKITKHKLIQTLLKTNNQAIKEYFNKPKSSTRLSDKDIEDILEGSKKGIGNDLMGMIKNIDGVCIRNIRKKFLTSEEYSKYHSIERFYSGDYNAYYNDRGDKFLSSWEEKVADFLFENKIKYITNIRLSYKNKNYSPDVFIVENRVFIEIFGLSNYNHYIPKMNEKINYYNDNKIKCLFLFQENFMEKNDFKDKINLFLLEIKDQKFNHHIVDNIFINGEKAIYNT